MDLDYIMKMEKCRHLLPPPGAEVVGECIAEILRLRDQCQKLEDHIKDIEYETLKSLYP